MLSTLIMTVGSNVPHTVEWSFSVGLVMNLSILLAIAIGRFAIQKAGQGPALPTSKPGLWKNFGIPELLATASFGHILGAGFVLGLSQAGVL